MDNEDKISKKKLHDEQEVTPKDLFRFAKAILLGISIMFILGMICKLIQQDTDIFESMKNILPSVATMVIGFYFGRTK